MAAIAVGRAVGVTLADCARGLDAYRGVERRHVRLGEAGGRLRWLMHGRYRFKGVPAPMLVHEVGEPGLSPLRAPDSGSKAWRELPLTVQISTKLNRNHVIHGKASYVLPCLGRIEIDRQRGVAGDGTQAGPQPGLVEGRPAADDRPVPG